MDEKKQIEEMASDMDYACTGKDLYPEDAKEIAKALYLLNYRKIPEGAVVLTREKHEALLLEQKRLREMVDRIPCGYELKDKTRKETARDIIEMLKPHCQNCDENRHTGCFVYEQRY